MDIVFATNNLHKLAEVRDMLPDNFRIDSLNDINCHEDIPETSDTLEGNAMQKARFIHEKYGKNCFADDTGLEVTALDYEPGVYSARYAGEQRNSDDNMDKVLRKLKGKTDRTARFRTVIALILDGEEYLFEGKVNGTIINERKGQNGFGYDPIFVPEGFDKTFAELSAHEKNSISHRARAVANLIQFLKNTEVK